MNYFEDLHRLVVKVGTSTLTHDTGRLNLLRMDHLARVLADLRNRGLEIILVSSGAIGVGVGKLKLPSKPHDIGGRQACAAVGQCELMYIYDKLFGEYGHVTAQVLLTRDCVDDRLRLQNIRNAFERLIDIRGRMLEGGRLEELMCLDGIHPNAQGHELIYRTVAPMLV